MQINTTICKSLLLFWYPLSNLFSSDKGLNYIVPILNDYWECYLSDCVYLQSYYSEDQFVLLLFGFPSKHQGKFTSNCWEFLPTISYKPIRTDAKAWHYQGFATTLIYIHGLLSSYLIRFHFPLMEDYGKLFRFEIVV